LPCEEQQWRNVSREMLGNHCWQSQQSRMELGVVSQRLIPTGEGSGLQTRIATTESVSLCMLMKS
jgi:hypothetical protein